MDNMKIYEAVRSVPQEAQKPFNTGRFSGTDINPMWRIKTLTEQFGVCGIGWYYEITNKEIIHAGEEQVAVVDINLYIKTEDGWSKPIVGTGGSKLIQKKYVNDEMYKMALTDALSVACKALGFGADIYWGKDKTKYSDAETQQITKMQAKNLRDYAERVEVSEDDICKRYNVASIDVMDEEQYGSCMKKLMATEEKRKAEKDGQ